MWDPIFKGRPYPPDVILWAVRWYCKYPLAGTVANQAQDRIWGIEASL